MTREGETLWREREGERWKNVLTSWWLLLLWLQFCAASSVSLTNHRLTTATLIQVRSHWPIIGGQQKYIDPGEAPLQALQWGLYLLQPLANCCYPPTHLPLTSHSGHTQLVLILYKFHHNFNFISGGNPSCSVGQSVEVYVLSSSRP